MNLLDASAVIAFLVGEPSAPKVRKVLEEKGAGMTSVQLAEVIDKLSRGRGVLTDDVLRVIDRLDIAVVPVTVETGVRAGMLRAERYHRVHCPLSMADCVLVATARAEDRVVSADRALLHVAAASGVGIVALAG